MYLQRYTKSVLLKCLKSASHVLCIKCVVEHRWQEVAGATYVWPPVQCWATCRAWNIHQHSADVPEPSTAQQQLTTQEKALHARGALVRDLNVTNNSVFPGVPGWWRSMGIATWSQGDPSLQSLDLLILGNWRVVWQHSLLVAVLQLDSSVFMRPRARGLLVW